MNPDPDYSAAYVTLETGATIDGVRQALTGHTLGQTQLLAMFQR